MAFEKQFDVRVNREGDTEEVLMREVDGVANIVLRPQGDERGFFRTGRARAVFTMETESNPVVPLSGKKSDKG